MTILYAYNEIKLKQSSIESAQQLIDYNVLHTQPCTTLQMQTQSKKKYGSNKSLT